MGQIQLTTALIAIGLFTVAIIGFALNFADDNNADITIADDPELTGLYTKTESNVTGFSEDAPAGYQSIIETNIEPESGVTTGVGAFAVTPLNAIGVVENILRVGWMRIFGSDSGFEIFLISFIALIVFMLGLFLYKTLRGNPD